MPVDPTNPWRRVARSQRALFAFLFGYVWLLIGICYYFLFPALREWKHASDHERASLRAWSALLLAILLVTLICGLILTIRPGRFFFPRAARPRTKTEYVDVWSEAGKRMATPDADEPEA